MSYEPLVSQAEAEESAAEVRAIVKAAAAEAEVKITLKYTPIEFIESAQRFMREKKIAARP